jgi:hypothetical protein
MRNSDQVLGVKEFIIPRHHIIDVNRVHVMNDDSVMDLVASNSKITTAISRDDFVSSMSPLHRRVESLVQVSLKPEGCDPDLRTQPQVIITLRESADTD